MRDAPKQSFSVPEVCDRLGVNHAKVVAWIKAGELRAINLASDRNGQRPRWRILLDDLLAFENGRAAIPAAEPVVRRKKRKADSRVIQFFK